MKPTAWPDPPWSGDLGSEPWEDSATGISPRRTRHTLSRSLGLLSRPRAESREGQNQEAGKPRGRGPSPLLCPLSAARRLGTARRCRRPARQALLSCPEAPRPLTGTHLDTHPPRARREPRPLECSRSCHQLRRVWSRAQRAFTVVGLGHGEEVFIGPLRPRLTGSEVGS